MRQIAAIPQIILSADRAELAAEAVRALSEVRVQQRLSLPTLCELTFRDPPGPLSRAADLAPGVPLRVQAQDHAEPLFEGEVTAVEHVYGPAHERAICVRGYDALHHLRRRQTVRAHRQSTLLDLARELGQTLGLAVQSALPGSLQSLIIQQHQSDLDLLADLAAQNGLYFTLHHGTLHLLTLEGDGEPLPLVLGETLLEARVEVNGEPACRAVTAAGWSPLRVESYSGEASQARSGRQVAGAAAPGALDGDGRRELPGMAAQDARHATMLAQAELDRRIAAEVTLWGVAEGDPRLRPGARVAVRGIDEALAGRYVLTSVTHSIDYRRGFVSELSTAPPAPRQPGHGAVATLGVVAKVNDPERCGRIRVALPAYGDLESEWMHVVCAGAGAGKGLVALPDVGDHVLVLLPHAEPGQGVVLGGLYGMGGPPDSGVEDGAVRRYTFVTPDGQRIRLDDLRRTIRLENSDGSYVELSPDRVRLHAAADLDLEAPGRAVVIRGQSIDFERG